jgi:hypothetical protein
MLGGKADRAFRTGPLAFRAKEAAAQIEPHAFLIHGNRIGWANLGTYATVVRTFYGINPRPAAQTVGQNRRHLRETDGAMLLLSAGQQCS